MSEQEIHTICKEYKIKNYSINPDGSIDVDDSVDLFNYNLNKIPLKFNKVNGYFDISHNNITSLEGSPKIVTSWFDCSHNNLISLKGIETVDRFIFCKNNPLESLEGYNNDYDKLDCENINELILKTKRKQKLKILEKL